MQSKANARHRLTVQNGRLCACKVGVNYWRHLAVRGVLDLFHAPGRWLALLCDEHHVLPIRRKLRGLVLNLSRAVLMSEKNLLTASLSDQLSLSKYQDKATIATAG